MIWWHSPQNNGWPKGKPGPIRPTTSRKKFAGRSCIYGAPPRTFCLTRWRAEYLTSDEVGARKCADGLRCSHYLVGQCTTFLSVEAGDRSRNRLDHVFPGPRGSKSGGGTGHGLFFLSPPKFQYQVSPTLVQEPQEPHQYEAFVAVLVLPYCSNLCMFLNKMY